MPGIQYTLKRVSSDGVWGWELRGQTVMDYLYCTKFLFSPADVGLMLSETGRSLFADPDLVNTNLEALFDGELLPPLVDASPIELCESQCQNLVQSASYSDSGVSIEATATFALKGPGRDGTGATVCVDDNGNPIDLDPSTLELSITETVPHGVNLQPLLLYIDVWQADESTPTEAVEALDAAITAWVSEAELRVVPSSSTSALYSDATGSVSVSLSGGVATITLTAGDPAVAQLILTCAAAGTWTPGGMVTFSAASSALIRYLGTDYSSSAMFGSPAEAIRNDIDNTLSMLLDLTESGVILVSEAELNPGARITLVSSTQKRLVDPDSERCRRDFTYGNRRPMLHHCGYVDFQLMVDSPNGFVQPPAMTYPACRVDVRVKS